MWPSVVAALALLLTLSNAAAAEDWQLFGSLETRNDNLDAFTKWQDVLDRHAAEEGQTLFVNRCEPGRGSDCRIELWHDLVNALEGLPARQQIDLVNAFFNDFPYVTDDVNWGVSDYWSTLREFLEYSGDCEDYAIAKYVTLKQAGFDPARMRLAIVEDLHLETPHAVLLVRLDDEVLVLDNQIATPVKASSIIHYRPIYSINETAWWLHRMPLPGIGSDENRTVLASPHPRESSSVSAGLPD